LFLGHAGLAGEVLFNIFDGDVAVLAGIDAVKEVVGVLHACSQSRVNYTH
jgi:hypothetical protein